MKMTRWVGVLAVAVAMWAGSAHAHLILENYYTGPFSGDPVWQQGWVAGELGIVDLAFLGKVEDDDQTIDEDPFGLLAGGYIEVSGYDNDEDRNALVHWDLTGTGWELAAVFIKNGRWHTLYSVSDDQVFTSGTWEPVTLDPSHTKGSISHISFFGRPGTTAVPDGGMTVMLMGLGFAGLALVRRVVF